MPLTVWKRRETNHDFHAIRRRRVYYAPNSSASSISPAAGTVSYIPLGGSAASSITAPIAGAFSPDNSYFFVSTAGDNMIHYISIPTLTDTEQISPNLPACSPSDLGCTYTGTDSTVPATVIEVKPRSTT